MPDQTSVTRSEPATAPTSQDVRRAVSEQLARLNSRDLDGFLERCDPEVVFTFPGSSPLSGVHKGREGLRRVFSLMHQLVPDLRFDYGHLLVLGDHAMVEWQDHGHTFRGEPFHNRGVTVMRFADGRVVEVRDYLDTEALTAFGSLGHGRRRSRA